MDSVYMDFKVKYIWTYEGSNYQRRILHWLYKKKKNRFSILVELALSTACFDSVERKKNKNSRTEKDVLASYTIFLI